MEKILCYSLFVFQIHFLLHSSSANNNNNYNKNKVPAIIVFGDSSVDSGNNNFIPTIARSNFEPYGRDFPDGNPTGRFSNGKIAPDFISEAFGLMPTVPAYLDPSYSISDFANGVCFASAGTGFDNATSNVVDVIPLWKEIEYYKEYQRKLRTYLGLPPMGCLPLERAINIMEFHGCVEEYNNVALEFNGKLGWLVSKLNKDLPGLQLVDANAYDILLQIVTQPSRFGFEVAQVGCCGTGRFEMSYLCDPKSPFTCSDANKYVFWDAFHPSEKTSQIVSNYLIEKYLAKFR
ncbi:hypothetical protein S83_023635 [Arachis hypogaea]